MKLLISIWTIVCFLGTGIPWHDFANAQLIALPVPGAMVDLSLAFQPVLIKGLRVHPDDPFQFDFIIDTGNTRLRAGNPRLNGESARLIRYFLTAMTVPEKHLWVNLSPYEKDRMIPPDLGKTVMGGDMLAQDYMLKQLTASLIYPEKDLGKKFWDEVYAKEQELYGTARIPVNTFNKVWIVADRADVFEHGDTAYVTGAHLKVMLQEDYLALYRNSAITLNRSHSITSNIIRQVIVPMIEKEVNTGRNFAPLRQMFYSMILASWYKMALKDAILSRIYGDKSKVRVGIDQHDDAVNDAIFQRYMKAYKKGVFNYIKDGEGRPGQIIAHKYFSGGEDMDMLGDPHFLRRITDAALISRKDLSPTGELVDASIRVDLAMMAPHLGQMGERPHFLRMVPRILGKRGEVQNVVLSEIFGLPLTDQEQDDVLAKVRDEPDIKAVLLKESVIRDDPKIRKGFSDDILLTADKGIIPASFLGKTVVLGASANLLMDSPRFNYLRELPQKGWVNIRANGFYIIKVRGYYLLTFNHDVLMQRRFLLSPPGGGYRFTENGESLYEQSGITPMHTIGDNPLEMHKLIYGENLSEFVDLFNRGIGREHTPLRELDEELIGPDSEVGGGGLFEEVPGSLRETDKAMTAVNGGIDLTRDQLKVTKQGAGVRMRFDPAMIGRVEHEGFDGLEFQIRSIVPVRGLSLLLGLDQR